MGPSIKWVKPIKIQGTKSMAKNVRKTFTKEFKEETAKLVVQQGYSIATAAQQLGIHERNVLRWVQEFKTGDKAHQKKQVGCELTDENKALKKQISRLTMENEILKKAAAFFATATMKNIHS